MELYIYVKSGFPVLAGYRGHVVSIVGHTIDYSRTTTEDSEGFIDSSQFLKQFIVIDDNFFPYQRLGWPDDPENYAAAYRKEYSIDSIITAVWSEKTRNGYQQYLRWQHFRRSES